MEENRTDKNMENNMETGFNDGVMVDTKPLHELSIPKYHNSPCKVLRVVQDFQCSS